jgi:YHS domain-containing protein
MKNLITLLVVATLIMGCEGTKKPTNPTKSTAADKTAKTVDKAATAPDKAATTITDKAVATAAAATEEQTICPVMDKPIDKQYKTEYKGKTVYFCCPACKPEFDKDPEKYIAKLPQFAKPK